MSKVRAKFVCNGLVEDGGETIQASFSPVIDGSKENESFAKYTPSGNLVLDITEGTPASKAFTEGEEYYLDITPVADENNPANRLADNLPGEGPMNKE